FRSLTDRRKDTAAYASLPLSTMSKSMRLTKRLERTPNRPTIPQDRQALEASESKPPSGPPSMKLN
ncbi:hypothetical protein AAII07_57975, partial [Microvirga sp. 0TCS3.31]